MQEPRGFADTHVRLLSVLFVVWGGLGVLAGAALLLLVAGAVAIAESPLQEASVFATRMTAASLAVFGAILVVGGFAHASVGVSLHRRRGPARPAALLLAALDLPLLPAGTMLGAYGIWILLDDRVRRLFNGAA